MNHFLALFTGGDRLNMEEAVEVVEHKVTDDMSAKLNLLLTVDEVSAAISQMHPTKAPSPNGTSAIFYQKFWGGGG